MAGTDVSTEKPEVHGFRSIAAWQAASFFLLLLLVWANEVLDLPPCLVMADGVFKNCVGSVLISVFVVLTAVITIGQTYVKQKRILSGFLTVCACCHKVRIKKHAWEAIEGYLSKRCPVEFSHGLCPECYRQEMAKLEAPPASPATERDPGGR